MRPIEKYLWRLGERLRMNEQEIELIKDEMGDHLALLKRDYMAKGYDALDAEKCAVYDFGEQKPICLELNRPSKLFYGLVWIAFVIYLLVLIKILFLGSLYQIMYGDYPGVSFTFERWSHTAFLQEPRGNFIPFATLHEYLFQADRFNFDIVLKNTIGQIGLMFPMGLFLPTLFQSLRKWKFFVSSILMVLIGIESMQYFTRSGVGDIDDVFLYILGSSSGFYGYHMISRFVRKARNASGSLSKR